MDTSREYAEMCRQAWRYLQREIEWDDIVAYRYIFDGFISKGIGSYRSIAEYWVIREENKSKVESDYIYILWKQDQLQKILFPDNWIPRECMVVMRKFQCFYEQNCDAFVSFEQLWLAFVMQEKYHEIWNGEEFEVQLELIK